MSDFAVTRKRMVRSPHLSFLSAETRQPDKLAIRKVIWQAAQSAFAAPLHLLNIMKSCSTPLKVNIKRIHRLEKTTEDGKWQSVHQMLCSAQVNKGLWTQWRSEEWVSQSVVCQLFRVCTLPLNSCLCFIHRGYYCSWSYVGLATFEGEGIAVTVLIYVYVHLFLCACVFVYWH